jgi:tetratricopeptide (TPR) repeat protein
MHSVEDMRTLISSLDLLDKKDRDRFLEGFKTDGGELRILFSSPWLSIKRGEKDDYEEYAEVLRDAVSAGRRWQHHPWMRAVTRILSAVLDEMLDRREDAEQIVIETIKEVGSSLNLEEQLAVIAFNHKEYGKALDIWQHVLPRWKSDSTVHDMQPYFGTRCAAIAAAMIGNWDLAADLFRQAIKRAENFSNRPWKIGLLGDRSYALWKSGDRKQAVKVFAECVVALEKLPNKPESFSEYSVQKLVGCALASVAVGDASVVAAFPGMCSNPDPDKRIKDLPPSPTIMLWYLVYTLAKNAGDDRLAARCVTKFRDAPFSFLQAMATKDSLERCLKSRRLDSVVRLATNLALGMEKSIQRESIQPDLPDPPGLTAQLTERSINAYVRPALWAGILRAKALGYNVTRIVEVWQKETDAVSSYIDEELTLCHAFSVWTAGKLASLLKDKEQSSERRQLASILLIGRDDTHPLDTLYAQVTLINTAKNYELLWDVSGQSFDQLVRRDWRRLIANRFLLRNPGIFIGQISEACESKKGGWSAAANVILAASPTVNLDFPDELWNKLRDLASVK